MHRVAQGRRRGDLAGQCWTPGRTLGTPVAVVSRKCFCQPAQARKPAHRNCTQSPFGSLASDWSRGFFGTLSANHSAARSFWGVSHFARRDLARLCLGGRGQERGVRAGCHSASSQHLLQLFNMSGRGKGGKGLGKGGAKRHRKVLRDNMPTRPPSKTSPVRGSSWRPPQRASGGRAACMRVASRRVTRAHLRERSRTARRGLPAPRRRQFPCCRGAPRRQALL